MKVTPIGVGQAGGKIVDQLASHSDDAELGVIVDAMVVNSSRPDLIGLRHLSQERRVLIGQSEVDGHGVGQDNERAAKLLNDDIEDIIYRLEETDFQENSEAFLLVGGLGGGMGSGGMPVLAKYLRERYDLPVYAVGVLPSAGEGHLASLNAMRSLSTLVHLTENVILFDNDAHVADDDTPLAASYSMMNEKLVVSLATLFAATEPAAGGVVGEQVIDAEDLKATLAAGDLSTIGYSDAELQRQDVGFVGSILGKKGDAPEDTSDQVQTVIQEAALGKLTAPASLSHLGGVLAMVAGPPEFLSQRGLEEAAQWLDEETNAEEMRTGDFPVEDDEDGGDADYMAGIVVLSGLTVVERLIEIYDRVVGLGTLAGMEQVEVEATDVMEAFFAHEDSPSPLFITKEFDLDALRVVSHEIDVSQQVGREDVDEFDWRVDQMDGNTEPEAAMDVNASAEAFESEEGEETSTSAETVEEPADDEDDHDDADDDEADEDNDGEEDADGDAEDDEESTTEDTDVEDEEEDVEGEDDEVWFGDADEEPDTDEDDEDDE